MDSLMQNSAYFGFFITLMGYWCAVQVGKRMRSTLCNPLLLSIIFIIAFLKLTNISYDSYDNGAKYINYFLTPSTVCLAVPLYRQLKLLKEYAGAIVLSILSGTAACAIMIFGLSKFFALEMIAGTVFKLFHIEDPVAQGLAMGTASHAIGTSKALEMGEIQAAMSSLAIAVAGLLTVIIGPIIAGLY